MPDAPVSVLPEPSAGSPPSAPDGILSAGSAVAAVQAVATITVPGNLGSITADGGIQINGQGGPIGPIANKSAQFIVDNILTYMWGPPHPVGGESTYGHLIDFEVVENVIYLYARPAGAAGNAWTISKFGSGNNLELSAGFSGGSDGVVLVAPVSVLSGPSAASPPSSPASVLP